MAYKRELKIIAGQEVEKVAELLAQLENGKILIEAKGLVLNHGLLFTFRTAIL